MAIKLKKDAEQRAITSIKHFVQEYMEEEIGDLKAAMLLEFVLREIGPCIYNGAVTDAQAHMQERVNELDGSCYEAEFTYWKR